VRLLVNKLVANTFKDAYPGQVNGEVWVNLAEMSQGVLRLTVVIM
jgi:hypothetical protein